MINNLKWVKTKNTENLEDIDFNLPAEGIQVFFKMKHEVPEYSDMFLGHVVYSGGAKFYSSTPNSATDETNPNDVYEWAYIDSKNTEIKKY